MKMKLAGISPMCFVNNVGETIKGTNLFVLYEVESVIGLKADKIFVKESVALPKDVKPNEMLDFAFDNRGKVMSISRV